MVISAVGKGPRAPLYCFVALSNRNERTMLSYKRGVSPPDGAKAEWIGSKWTWQSFPTVQSHETHRSWQWQKHKVPACENIFNTKSSIAWQFRWQQKVDGVSVNKIASVAFFTSIKVFPKIELLKIYQRSLCYSGDLPSFFLSFQFLQFLETEKTWINILWHFYICTQAPFRLVHFQWRIQAPPSPPPPPHTPPFLLESTSLMKFLPWLIHATWQAHGIKHVISCGLTTCNE